MKKKYPETFKKANLYIKENITFNQYRQDIQKIKKYIEKGTTYEVNYTYSNDIITDTDGYSLFLNLIQNQKRRIVLISKMNLKKFFLFLLNYFFQ